MTRFRRFHTTTIDGVPCVWMDDDSDTLLGALLFRVGFADETIGINGISHLVEHLALPAGTVPAADFNGTTDMLTTLFWVHGPPERVAEELTTVTERLSSPPRERIGSERGIIRAEAETRGGGDSWRLATSLRFGPVAHGLIGYNELAPYAATDDAIVDWSRVVAVPDGVAARGEGWVQVVPWERVIGVQRWSDGTRRVWSDDGFTVYIDPADWQSGAAAIYAIDEATDPDTWIARGGADRSRRLPHALGSGVAVDRRGRGRARGRIRTARGGAGSRCRRIDPANERAIQNLALVRGLSGDLGTARALRRLSDEKQEAILQEEVERFPTDAALRRRLVDILRDLGRHHDALRAARELLELGQEEPASLGSAAWSALGAGEIHEARDCAQTWLGLAELAEGDREAALRAYERAEGLCTCDCATRLRLRGEIETS